MKLFTPLMMMVVSLWPGGQIEGNSEKINSASNPKFPITSGSVTYSISGDGTGSSILYFDRNGWSTIEHRELILNRYGITSSEKVIELVDGDYHYKANLDAGTGKKGYDKSWSGLLGYKSKAETIEAIMTTKGGQLKGTEVVIDKICHVWVFAKGPIKEIWEWEGIPLKIKKEIPGIHYELTATEITENIEFPNDELMRLNDIVWSN